MVNKPFPDDPQWLQLSRKLPPDAVVAALVRFGFRPADIAKRFGCHRVAVRQALRNAGVPPVPHIYHCNGSRRPYKVRLFNPVLERRRGALYYVEA